MLCDRISYGKKPFPRPHKVIGLVTRRVRPGVLFSRSAIFSKKTPASPRGPKRSLRFSVLVFFFLLFFRFYFPTLFRAHVVVQHRQHCCAPLPNPSKHLCPIAHLPVRLHPSADRALCGSGNSSSGNKTGDGFREWEQEGPRAHSPRARCRNQCRRRRRRRRPSSPQRFQSVQRCPSARISCVRHRSVIRVRGFNF